MTITHATRNAAVRDDVVADLSDFGVVTYNGHFSYGAGR
jgi:hypothetical protein